MEVEVGSSAGTAVTAAGGCTFSRKLLVADIAKDAETIGVDVDNFGCRLDRRSVDFHSHAEHACKGGKEQGEKGRNVSRDWGVDKVKGGVREKCREKRPRHPFERHRCQRLFARKRRGLLREFEPAKGAGSQDSLESSGSGTMLRKELKRAGWVSSTLPIGEGGVCHSGPGEGPGKGWRG